jgi:hypothetical protein
MPWKRCGLIYSPGAQVNREWAVSHAQCPTPELLSETTLRIYFGTRDAKNRTRPTFIDVDPNNPAQVNYVHDRPILELGELGCFDDAGVMPFCVINVDGRKLLYYAGWNTSTTVPYRISIGLAVSDDGGNTFRRIHQGPILDRSLDEPHFCSTPFVVRESSQWRMWFLSCRGWRRLKGRPEPQYDVRSACSDDGIHWRRDGSIAIGIDTSEEAIARPWVLAGANRWRMWYCHRSLDGYRTDKGSSYRIGYAESADNGATWKRLDRLGGCDPSESGWDGEMAAYPATYEHQGRLYLLYNGNGFGRSGFGYAACEEPANDIIGVASGETRGFRQQARVC